MSKNDIKPQDTDSDVQTTVSKYLYAKHRTVNNFDELTAKKSDVEELLKDTNEHNSTKDLIFLDEQNLKLKENQEENNEMPREDNDAQNNDDNSLSSILSDTNSIKNKINPSQYSPSSSSSSSSEDSLSTSSHGSSLSSYKYYNNDSDTDSTLNSIRDEINKNIKEKNKEKKSNNYKKRKSSKLTSDKECPQALQMIKFLGTLQMKKLDLKHEPRLRKVAFLEWI